MQIEEIWKKLAVINTWKRGTQRAPHKPLLLLYALGRYSRGGERMIPYEQIDRDLRELLMTFGPNRKSYHPEYPFWRLQNDGIWELSHTPQLKGLGPNQDVSKSTLLEYGVSGGLIPELFQALQGKPALIETLAMRMLDEYFTPGVYPDILAAVGLTSPAFPYESVRRKRRDSRFRQQILAAYDNRCAMCGFDLKLGNRSLALEASHIQWHCYHGPDEIPNGIALCTIHHELFDQGAWTLAENRTIYVSHQVQGTVGLAEWLLRFAGQQLLLPQDIVCEPRIQYVKWHQKEVCKG